MPTCSRYTIRKDESQLGRGATTCRTSTQEKRHVCSFLCCYKPATSGLQALPKDVVTTARAGGRGLTWTASRLPVRPVGHFRFRASLNLKWRQVPFLPSLPLEHCQRCSAARPVFTGSDTDRWINTFGWKVTS